MEKAYFEIVVSNTLSDLACKVVDLNEARKWKLDEGFEERYGKEMVDLPKYVIPVGDEGYTKGFTDELMIGAESFYEISIVGKSKVDSEKQDKVRLEKVATTSFVYAKADEVSLGMRESIEGWAFGEYVMSLNYPDLISYCNMHTSFMSALYAVSSLTPEGVLADVSFKFQDDLSSLTPVFIDHVIKILKNYSMSISYRKKNHDIEKVETIKFEGEQKGSFQFMKHARLDFSENNHVTSTYHAGVQCLKVPKPLEESNLALIGSDGGKDSTLSTMILSRLGFDVKSYNVTRDIGLIGDFGAIDIEVNVPIETNLSLTKSMFDKSNHISYVGESYYLVRQVCTQLLAFAPAILELMTTGSAKASLAVLGAEYATDHVDANDLSLDHGYIINDIAKSYNIPEHISPIAGLTELGILGLLLKNTKAFDKWEEINSCWTRQEIPKVEGTEIKSCEYCGKCNRYKAMITALTVCGDKEIEDKALAIVDSWMSPKFYIDSKTHLTYSATNWLADEVLTISKLKSISLPDTAKSMFKQSNLFGIDNSETMDRFQGKHRKPIMEEIMSLGKGFLKENSVAKSLELNKTAVDLALISEIRVELIEQGIIPKTYLAIYEMADLFLKSIIDRGLVSEDDLPELYLEDPYTMILSNKYEINPRFLGTFRNYIFDEDGNALLNNDANIKPIILEHLPCLFRDKQAMDDLGDIENALQSHYNTVRINYNYDAEDKNNKKYLKVNSDAVNFAKIYINVNTNNTGIEGYLDWLHH